MSNPVKLKVKVAQESVDIASTLLPLRVPVTHYRIQPRAVKDYGGQLGGQVLYCMSSVGVIVNNRVAVMNWERSRDFDRALMDVPTKRWLVRWKTPYGSEFGIVKAGVKKLDTVILLRVEHSPDDYISFNHSSHLDMMIIFPDKWTPIGIDMGRRTVVFNPYG